MKNYFFFQLLQKAIFGCCRRIQNMLVSVIFIWDKSKIEILLQSISEFAIQFDELLSF